MSHPALSPFDQALLDSLPKLSAADLAPKPAWARDMFPSTSSGEGNEDGDEEEEEEEWADALEEHREEDESETGDDEEKEKEEEEKTDFTDEELRSFLTEATKIKTQANTAFTTSPPNFDLSLALYKSALSQLPSTSLSPSPSSPAPPTAPALPDTGITELTDEQAAQLEVEEEVKRRKEEEENKPEVKERRRLEGEVEELRKVIWGNMGAVYVKMGDDKEAVKACTEALKIDSLYLKALQRRAAANQRIGSWSSLTSSLEDYKLLQPLLAPSSPLLPPTRSALTALPQLITAAQEKEKDEMLGKLKELGDGILGKFGLSTDMFKFDKGEGGGYSMRFER